jgi:acyl-CoA synthetase (AMP-forming)/AMP-acid ligase II
MSAPSRLNQLLSHVTSPRKHPANYHPLNPTYFLPRSAGIYGDAMAVQHRSADGVDFSRSYVELASRAAGLAYFLREEMGLKRGERVAVVGPNTPMFLEAFFGVAGAGGSTLTVNNKLTEKGIAVRGRG